MWVLWFFAILYLIIFFVGEFSAKQRGFKTYKFIDVLYDRYQFLKNTKW